MTNKFMFYENFLAAIDALPENQRGKFCYELCRYGITGELPDDIYIKVFCLGVSASVHKYDGRGGNNNPTGKNQHTGKEVKEVKTGQRGQNEVKEDKEDDNNKHKHKHKLETKTETLNPNVNLKEDIPPCIPPLKEGNDKTEDKPTEKNPEKNKRFVKPHIDEINAFCDENDIVIDAEAFYDYFESKGWTVGKAPMKDWKAAVRNWYRRQSPETTAKLEKENNPTSFDELYELTMKKLAAKQSAQKEHDPITGQQKAEINQITNSLFKSPDAGKPAANDDFKHYRGF